VERGDSDNLRVLKIVREAQGIYYNPGIKEEEEGEKCVGACNGMLENKITKRKGSDKSIITRLTQIRGKRTHIKQLVCWGGGNRRKEGKREKEASAARRRGFSSGIPLISGDERGRVQEVTKNTHDGGLGKTQGSIRGGNRCEPKGRIPFRQS